MLRIPVIIPAAFALFISAAAGAFAHAFLDHATPAAGSTVKRAPSELKLRFTEELEPAFSTVRVVDAGGKQVDKGGGHLDAKDRTLLELPLPPLPPGIYRVVWRVVSVDTHATRGEFKFTVAP
ncbi:MAG TPA: copper homeostasis periplasmic binding protein CopC [Alphaproteobacteria bacterium]|nr:copper homeostasis periplasmic binding protein CopC [Alphaproteobacteria bacterium]